MQLARVEFDYRPPLITDIFNTARGRRYNWSSGKFEPTKNQIQFHRPSSHFGYIKLIFYKHDNFDQNPELRTELSFRPRSLHIAHSLWLGYRTKWAHASIYISEITFLSSFFNQNTGREGTISTNSWPGIGSSWRADSWHVSNFFVRIIFFPDGRTFRGFESAKPPRPPSFCAHGGYLLIPWMIIQLRWELNSWESAERSKYYGIHCFSETQRTIIRQMKNEKGYQLILTPNRNEFETGIFITVTNFIRFTAWFKKYHNHDVPWQRCRYNTNGNGNRTFLETYEPLLHHYFSLLPVGPKNLNLYHEHQDIIECQMQNVASSKKNSSFKKTGRWDSLHNQNFPIPVHQVEPHNNAESRKNIMGFWRVRTKCFLTRTSTSFTHKQCWLVHLISPYLALRDWRLFFKPILKRNLPKRGWGIDVTTNLALKRSPDLSFHLSTHNILHVALFTYTRVYLFLVHWNLNR